MALQGIDLLKSCFLPNKPLLTSFAKNRVFIHLFELPLASFLLHGGRAACARTWRAAGAASPAPASGSSARCGWTSPGPRGPALKPRASGPKAPRVMSCFLGPPMVPVCFGWPQIWAWLLYSVFILHLFFFWGGGLEGKPKDNHHFGGFNSRACLFLRVPPVFLFGCRGS